MSSGYRTVVIRSSAKLEFKFGRLVVRTIEDTKEIFLDEISVLIIESPAVNLTAYLLMELSERNIKVIFCDKRHVPVSELVNVAGSHDTSKKIQQQIAWTQENKDLVWQHVVKTKIANQQLLLRRLHHDELADRLSQYSDEVTPGDTRNREATVAKMYFGKVFGIDFVRFKDDSINAMLNYGYTILASLFSREIVACGYLPQLGVGHKSVHNSFNLSYDLIEPFRPVVDQVALKHKGEHLSPKLKAEFIDIVNCRVKTGASENTLMNAARIFTKQCLGAVENGEVSRVGAIEVLI